MATFTANEMRELLVKVGLNPVPADALDRTFAELQLDSLARVEIATRLQESHGADLEFELTTGEGLTPSQVISMVASAASPAAS